MSNHITSLHNYLQGRSEAHTLTWVETPSGPCNHQTWTIECKVAGEIKGTGSGLSKADAKQTAAQIALARILSSAKGAK